jgi:hypothetical protein
MAEQEVIKHTKKVYKVWHSKEHSLWQKCKEFLLEIFIIVFAVTISIWFHNRSEQANQQENVKQFLLGLKSDLVNDVKEMQNDKQSYLLQQAAFEYIASVKMNQSLNEDSLNIHKRWIFNTTGLNPNNGRFEGFKSSGRIGLIENNELQNDIMDLYQEDIVSLLVTTNYYIDTKKKLFEYIYQNTRRLTDSTNNLGTILATDESENICSKLKSPKQVFERYDSCINKAKKIIKEIDQEYRLEE